MRDRARVRSSTSCGSAVDDGSVDTVLLAIADMEGRLQGKRLTASHFLDEVAEHAAEGCNYLLAVDVDMDTVSGLRDVRLAPRLRGLRDEARPRHAAGDPLARGHGPPDGRPRVGGRLGRGGVAAPDPPPPARPARRARLDARRRAPSSSSSSSTTPTRRRGARATATSSRRTSTTSTTRCSAPRAWSRSSAGSGTRCRAPGCGSRTRRASATSASTRSTSATTTRSRPRTTHALYKTGAKEIAAQEGYAITFIAKLDEREGNSCHIHCSLQKADGSGSVFAEDETTFNRFVAGPARLPARAHALLRPAGELVQALRGGLVRADRGGVGPRQPHLLDARGRARAGPAGGEPAARAPT